VCHIRVKVQTQEIGVSVSYEGNSPSL